MKDTWGRCFRSYVPMNINRDDPSPASPLTKLRKGPSDGFKKGKAIVDPSDDSHREGMFDDLFSDSCGRSSSISQGT